MFLGSYCSCLCPTHLSQVLSREWRCSWSNADRRSSNYIWVINNFVACLGTSYIKGLTVYLAAIILPGILTGQYTMPCCKESCYNKSMWHQSITNKNIFKVFIIMKSQYCSVVLASNLPSTSCCMLGVGMLDITMTSQWAWWRLRSSGSRLFTQRLFGRRSEKNIKAPRHWPLCVEFTGGRWIPRTNGQ